MPAMPEGTITFLFTDIDGSTRMIEARPLGPNVATNHIAYVLYNSCMNERRISEARESFSTTVNRVAFGGERVVLTRHGKRVAAVVPIADLDLLEQLEDAADLDEVRGALADPANREPVAWDKLKAQLGL
jgi:prevent-host-death family protein